MSELDLSAQPRALVLADLSPAAATAGHPLPTPTRADGWTLERQRKFLEALAEGAPVRAAAAGVGMSHVSAYALRRRAEGRAFAQGWDAARTIGRGALAARVEELAWDRAVNGTDRQHFRHGEPVAESREDSGIT
jgi:hypothetical protein